jgi:hypothetical protein
MAAGQIKGKVAPKSGFFFCRNDSPGQWHVCCPSGNSYLLPENTLFELPFFSHLFLSTAARKWPNFEGLEAPFRLLFFKSPHYPFG